MTLTLKIIFLGSIFVNVYCDREEGRTRKDDVNLMVTVMIVELYRKEKDRSQIYD